jgi:hypothetical protein
MLYVGSFSNYKELEGRSTHFIYIAEADDPNSVVDVFKAGIKKTTKQSDTCIHGKIYLESIIEINKVPPGGAMAFLQEIDYQDPGSTISCTLPGDSRGLESYGWSEDGKEPNDDDDIYEMTPLLTIPALKKTKAPGGQIDFTKKRHR